MHLRQIMHSHCVYFIMHSSGVWIKHRFDRWWCGQTLLHSNLRLTIYLLLLWSALLWQPQLHTPLVHVSEAFLIRQRGELHMQDIFAYLNGVVLGDDCDVHSVRHLPIFMKERCARKHACIQFDKNDIFVCRHFSILFCRPTLCMKASHSWRLCFFLGFFYY